MKASLVPRAALAPLFLAALVACSDTDLSSIDTHTAALTGRVSTTSGSPAPGVLLALDGRQVQTGPDGRFAFDELPFDVRLDLLARSDAYSTAHHRLLLRDRETRELEVRVLPAQVDVLPDPTVPSSLTTKDGVVLELPASSLFRADGTPATGPVTVRTSLLQTREEVLAAPGGLVARVGDEEVYLESFGMAEVRFEQDGAELEFDGKARLTLPLSPTARFEHGESIPLWSFSEEEGVWLPEGEGIVLDGRFEAEVDHFTWWNPDVPIEITCLDGRVIDPFGEPVPEVILYSEGIDYLGTTSATAGPTGAFSLLVRGDSTVRIRGAASVGFGAVSVDLTADTPPMGSSGCIDLGTVVASDTFSDDDGDGFSETAGDCDDGDADRHPDAEELCNWIDEDCNGLAEQGPDLDNDGEGDCLDCNDADHQVHTGGMDICDGAPDNDCDGQVDPREADLDGDGLSFCDGDCDDADPSVTDDCAFTEVVATGSTSCGLRPDGAVVCWGGVQGVFAIGDGAGDRFIDLDGTTSRICGLQTDGDLWCWSEGTDPERLPVQGRLVSLSVGASHVCGLDVDGLIRCSGDDSWGQTSPPAGVFGRLSSGALHSCAVDLDGAVRCWGADEAGQAAPPDLEAVDVSAGGVHSCALSADGEVLCWGDSSFGQLRVPGSWQFVQLSSGAWHACGVTHRGTVACWGRDEHGQATPPPGRFRSVHAGEEHTCALDLQGRPVCWGRDEAGQLRWDE